MAEKKKAAPGVAAALRESNYHFIIHPNIGYRRELLDPAFSARFRSVMRDILNELEFLLDTPEFQRRKERWAHVDVFVKSYSFNLERGANNKRLHADGVLKLSNFCWVNTKAVEEYVKSELIRTGIRDPSLPHGVQVKFNYFRDSMAVQLAYSKKQQDLRPSTEGVEAGMFTKAQLNKIAAENGVRGRSTMDKAQLWEAVKKYVDKSLTRAAE